MKNKQQNEHLRSLIGLVCQDLDDAATSAEDVLHTVRVNGSTGTRYLHLLRAIEKLRDRAYQMDAALADGGGK